MSEEFAADFYPRLLKNRFLQSICLLRIVTQLVEILACLLPCSGVTDKWPLSRSFYAGPAKWRENNGVKMTSWLRKKFPVGVSETKRVKITLPCCKSLTAGIFEPKRRFWSAFPFPGTRNKWMYYSNTSQSIPPPVCARVHCGSGQLRQVQEMTVGDFRFSHFPISEPHQIYRITLSWQAKAT